MATGPSTMATMQRCVALTPRAAVAVPKGPDWHVCVCVQCWRGGALSFFFCFSPPRATRSSGVATPPHRKTRSVPLVGTPQAAHTRCSTSPLAPRHMRATAGNAGAAPEARGLPKRGYFARVRRGDGPRFAEGMPVARQPSNGAHGVVGHHGNQEPSKANCVRGNVSTRRCRRPPLPTCLGRHLRTSLSSCGAARI